MKKLLSLSLIGASLMTATSAFAEQFPFRDKPFPDVATTHPSYAAIEYLREHNIIRGYVDGTFKTDRRLSRAEYTVLLTNPFFLDGTAADTCIPEHFPEGDTQVYYSDVHVGDWFANAVCLATANKIVDGFPDGTYQPHDSVTFVQAAKIAANVFAFDIKQDEMAEDWYVPYVQRLADLKAIPTSIKRFDQIITRAEAAEIIFRLKTNDQTKASASFSSLK